MTIWKRHAERRALDTGDLDTVLAEIQETPAELTGEQQAFVAEAFGPEPEDTDPNGADLAPPEVVLEQDPIVPRPVRRQKLYPDTHRCQAEGCGAPCVGEMCVPCTVAGRQPEPEPPEWMSESGYQPPMSEDAIRNLVLAVFTCEHVIGREGVAGLEPMRDVICGRRLGHDMLCPEGGRAHASADMLRWMDEVEA